MKKKKSVKRKTIGFHAKCQNPRQWRSLVKLSREFGLLRYYKTRRKLERAIKDWDRFHPKAEYRIFKVTLEEVE